MVTRNLLLTPAVAYSLPFTDVSSQGDWKASGLAAGLGLGDIERAGIPYQAKGLRIARRKTSLNPSLVRRGTNILLPLPRGGWVGSTITLLIFSAFLAVRCFSLLRFKMYSEAGTRGLGETLQGFG